jgi:UDP-2,3-diacylglucosamine pyrophosphatase LpxH
MKIFISDFHISSPLFQKENEIMEIISRPGVSEVYLLGDILDTWEEDPYDTKINKKEFISFLNTCGKVVVMLKGNHDPDLKTMRYIFTGFPVLYQHEMELFGKKTILVHGDEFDSSTILTRLVFPIHFLLSRTGVNMKCFFREGYHKFLVGKNNASKDELVFKNEKKLFEKYSKDYDLIISGHTHVAKLVRTGNGDYANCGSTICEPSYLVAENNTLRIERF